MKPRVLKTVVPVTSIARARKLVDKFAGGGVLCPCCNQLVKEYRRPFNAEMARWLVFLAKTFERTDGAWVDVRDFNLRGGDYAKAAHWALMVRRPNSDPALRTSGLWKPTREGLAFAHDLITIPRFVHLRDGSAFAFSGDRIGVRTALGSDFSYAELWE